MSGKTTLGNFIIPPSSTKSQSQAGRDKNCPMYGSIANGLLLKSCLMPFRKSFSRIPETGVSIVTMSAA